MAELQPNDRAQPRARQVWVMAGAVVQLPLRKMASISPRRLERIVRRLRFEYHPSASRLAESLSLFRSIPTMSTAILEIEAFVQPLMGAVIAHDYKHADRVRRRAKQIAVAEGYPFLEAVEAAALLHDIGLSQEPGREHAAVGAAMAKQFLLEQGYFVPEQIAEIVAAIRDHSSVSGSGRLFKILQDADGLELFGAIGLLRGISSKGHLADYEPGNIRGSTWALTADDFTERFRVGVGVGSYILDQLNFQISCYENLHTQTAKHIAAPLVTYVRSFILQLEAEIIS